MEHQDNSTTNIRLNKRMQKMVIDRRNKIFLGMFLGFCLLTFACKVIDGIILDLGYRDGKANLGFWTDHSWFDNLVKGTPEYYAAKTAVDHHPNTIWFITQFTWITTIMIILFLSIRLFKYDGKTPKWLKWIMTQRTLSWVATFDTVVAIVFWASMYKGFSEGFNSDLKAFEMTYTIFVHAVIPFFVLVYSWIYLIYDRKASLLRISFIWRGLVYISAYMTLYLILTIVWTDPYPVTTMHDDLVEHGWAAWAKQLWKLPLAIGGVYIILGVMFITHNFLLLKYNKKYKVENDYEANLNKWDQIKHFENQVMKDIMKRMNKAAKRK